MFVRWLVFCLLAMMFLGSGTATAQGVIFPSAGAVHRSMAGASTAAPIDAAGATYWNPAVISGLRDTEIFVGADFVYADTFLLSSLESTGQSAENRSESGLSPMPAMGVVSRPENSTFTYGLGIYALVGRTIDFPGNRDHPVLGPYNPPRSYGVGPVASSFSGLQIAPMLAKRFSESLSIGGGPTVTSLSLLADPAFFAERNANGTFPPATHSRPRWGAGFQIGVYYTAGKKWSLGASLKSPQWFETFEYNSKDVAGFARTLQREITLPAIFSGGVAYRGFERAIIAVDVRYFDYSGTDMFGDQPSAGGLGWKSIWAIAAGTQVRIREHISAQFGYAFNQNPIPEAATLFNIQIPAINKNAFSGGLTIGLTEKVDITGSVVYALSHENQGTLLQIPDSFIQMKQDLATFSLGFSFRP